MDERERRMAQNEALFKEVNERVEGLAQTHRPARDAPYEFLCECANGDCTFRITLPPLGLRGGPGRPDAIRGAPDALHAEIEELVAEEETHWVVRKPREAGEYVKSLDSRSR